MRFLLRLMTLPLLTETDKQNLLNYRYSGGDSSPIYQNILSPFAQFWVDLLPLWMAPNVVTSLGLICSILAAICTAIFNPDLAAHAPRWLHLMSCLCILAYQTFDNMDGKQARRTGSSSPLGMLFDHGCDAVNAGLLCIPIASALATGWTPNFFLCLWSGFAAFYFQAWEEYYVGTMVLPPFNGPTEGLLMSAGTCLLSFFFDSQFWHESILSPGSPSITPFHCACAIAAPMTGYIAVVQVADVLRFVREKGQSQWTAFADLLPFLVFFPSMIAWYLLSDVPMQRYPFITHLFVSSVLVELVMHILFTHVSQGKLRPFERDTAFSVALFPTICVVRRILASDASRHALVATLGRLEVVMLFTLTAVSFATSALFLTKICTECAMLLGVNVFTLKKRSSSNSGGSNSNSSDRKKIS